MARIVQPGVMLRCALAFFLFVLPLSGAASTPTPLPGATARATVHDGGVVAGTITSVNYQRSTIGIDARGRGHLEVDVMPSTSIQGNDSAYHAITDLRAGERVQIFSSIAGGKYVAQIIRIVK